MTSMLALERQDARWYPLKDHPVQLALRDAVPNGIRFPLVPAGRRSGKTERFKRFLIRQANRVPGYYFAAAPTHDQAKKIFWNDLKTLSYSAIHPKPPSESERIIYLPTPRGTSEIHVIGLDKPQRIEGIPWKGGGVDEFGNVKEGAWEENLQPALNTVNPNEPDYRAWCWLFGVPEGMNHYYDLCDKAEHGSDPDFGVFHWKSSEILPPDVIEAAKRQMSPRQFRQEYEASFETASGRVYEDYGKDNFTDAQIQSHERLCWFHDFNYTPLSSGIGVIRDITVGGKTARAPYLLEEIILTSAVARQSALEFVDRYKDHGNRHVLIYGDPSGRAGEKHGHASDYTEIEAVLRDHKWTFTRNVKSSTESIKDGQNAVRAKIRNAADEVSLFVNPQTAPWTHKALATVQLKQGSTFLEEDGDYQHIGTAVRYLCDYEWPVLGRGVVQMGLGGI